jgi:hypothetical protein
MTSREVIPIAFFVTMLRTAQLFAVRMGFTTTLRAGSVTASHTRLIFRTRMMLPTLLVCAQASVHVSDLPVKLDGRVEDTRRQLARLSKMCCRSAVGSPEGVRSGANSEAASERWKAHPTNSQGRPLEHKITNGQSI